MRKSSEFLVTKLRYIHTLMGGKKNGNIIYSIGGIVQYIHHCHHLPPPPPSQFEFGGMNIRAKKKKTQRISRSNPPTINK